MKHRTFYITFIPLLFFIIYFLTNWSYFNQACFEIGDIALTTLKAKEAKSFDVFTGAYSRYKFNHLGPIYFYIYAFGETLIPYINPGFNSYILIQLILSCILLSLSLIIINKLASLRVACLAFLSLLLSLSFLPPDIFLSIWGPATTIIPMFACIISATAIFTGHYKSFALFIISAILLSQNHLGTLSLIVPLLILVFSFLFYQRKKLTNRDLYYIFISLSFSIICFLPTIYELLLYKEESNILKIISFFNNPPYPKVSFSRTLKILVSFFSMTRPKEVNSFSYLIFFSILLFSIFSLKRLNTFTKNLFLISCFILIFSFIAIKNIIGTPYSYLIWYLHSLTAIFYLFIIVPLLNFPKEKYIYIITLIITIIISFSNYKLFSNPYCDISIESYIQTINPDKKHTYQLKMIGGNYGKTYKKTAGIFLELKQRGYNVCVPKRWSYMFGKNSSCNQAINKTISIEYDKASKDINIIN